ncbi:methyltransferase-like protein 22 isoform X2 [Limulus polyphemus]|nr:methyltransferase-like protein 22 isoform X2 [Limulus polyphemus]XP_013788407.1 methyltransferase-like protein 22 isoform X2 [Limulus polyphemus]XP_022256632.1 methyltransferase-like protein 22 isoform X2 [Limulus polyphemus]
MKADELVLSDVHLYSDNRPQDKLVSIVACVTASDEVKSQLKVVQSHFVFKLPGMQQYNDNALERKELSYDDDGDLLVKREESDEKEVMLLNHFLCTPLDLVGLQVWSGALLLSDYLLCYGHKILNEHHVLELGAGSGLCSIIAGMFSSCVFCTDFVDNVLEFSQNNVEMNKHLLGYFQRSNSICEKSCPVIVKRFDWTKHECEINLEDPWGWTMQEKDDLKKVNVILAADVIYDDNLTDAFFETVIRLMLQPPSKVLYISLEKRINFSLDVMDVACPAYTHFYQYLQNLPLHSGHQDWDVQQVPTFFPQLFHYKRTPQLELWRVEALLSK